MRRRVRTLNLQPRPGKAWKPHGQPVRLRATYHRHHGVRHMIASLDLATGRIHYRIRDRKRAIEFLDFLKTLRQRWPGQRLYLILDNFSPHKHPTVTAWCHANRVELVFLLTYSSWLNWIEAEFAALRYFALNGTDHRSHDEQDTAIGDYIRWHNQRAKPKTGYATNSKIRHPDYPSRPHDEALGDQAAVDAARSWHRSAWELAYIIRGINPGGGPEWQIAMEKVWVARAKFYECARLSLGVQNVLRQPD
ncbi:transposase [Micromonospora sp. M12]